MLDRFAEMFEEGKYEKARSVGGRALGGGNNKVLFLFYFDYWMVACEIDCH